MARYGRGQETLRAIRRSGPAGTAIRSTHIEIVAFFRVPKS